MIETDVRNSIQSTAVVVESSDALTTSAQHFELTPCGLVIIGDPSYEECRRYFISLTKLSGAINLSIGALLNHVEIRYGETYAQFEAEWDKDVAQLYNFKWIDKQVPLEMRREFSYKNDKGKPPSFTLCKHVASLSDKQKRIEVLNDAAVLNLNSTMVKAIVDKINGKAIPPLSAFVSRALAPLRTAAEAYPSARRKLKNIIEELEGME